ncbi:MAG: hypothetical protein GXX99_01370 [Clostridiales bacterium]|nr:hypothetical protein [Clostridiales bacterium]
MKNLSISKKLIVGFGAILIMILFIIGMSVYSIGGINEQIQSYAKYTLPNSTSIWVIRRDTVSIQRDMASAMAETDPGQIEKWLNLAHEDSASLLGELDNYEGNQRDDSRSTQLAELRELFARSKNARLEITELMKDPTEDHLRQAKERFERDYVPVMDQAVDILIDFTKTAEARALQQEQDAMASVRLAWIILGACGVGATVLSVLMTLVIRRSILTPVNVIVDAYEEIAKGNMRNKRD